MKSKGDGMIFELPVKMVIDTKKKTVMIEFTEDYHLVIGGKWWWFEKGWQSDGHSVGIFKHFDAWTLAALPHDQTCETANRFKDYSLRRKGDRQYRVNLKALGAPKRVWMRRYAGVSLRAWQLKLTGKLK